MEWNNLFVNNTEDANVYRATTMESLLLPFDPNLYIYNIHYN
jgi:hypothetical protein